MNGETVATAPASDAADVDAAVRAAREAVDSRVWSDLRAADRAIALNALADALQARERDAGELIAREMGKPIRVARGREVGGAIDRLRYFAGAARALDGRFVGAPPSSLWDMEIPEPVGVAALIIPWNDPIDLLIRKLGAALAAGCAVVIKPSELTPASTAMVVELADELGVFPPGVLNMVHGPGLADRRGAGRSPGRGQGRVHRFDRDRHHDHAARRPSGSRASRWSAAARHLRSCSPTPI